MVNSNGTYFTNSQVAMSYNQNFYVSAPNAQVLAAALAAYVTNTSLVGGAGGTYASQYGFNVSFGGTGVEIVSLGADAAAFGNNSSLTVLQMLQSLNSQAVGGVLFAGSSQKTTLVNLASDAFNTKVNAVGGLT
jgi:hypothetical protein